MSLNKARLASLADKLSDIESVEVPVDVPTEEAKKVEEEGVKKELNKVKKGK